MIRPLTIVTFLMACGSGLYLYQSKHAAQVLDRDIERDGARYRQRYESRAGCSPLNGRC